MKPKSSCNFNGMLMILFKIYKEVIMEPLLVIINQTLINGMFHDKLKIATINPIHKKYDKS